MDWQRLKERIKRHEGLRLRPYRDTEGNLTIGYGRNLDAKGITEHEADVMLDADLRDAYLMYIRLFPERAKKNLTEVGEEVIVEMFFNLGEKVLTFKKMIQAIIDGDAEKAAYEMLDSKWHKQVKGRAEELAEIMKNEGIVKK